MSSVVKMMAKYGGACLMSAFLAGKIFGPLIIQLQKIKTEEIITDESIIRRFEQSLIEGETKFLEEYPYISDMLKSYFNIEGITERLRTCRQEDKRDLWNDMKILVFARLMSNIYLNYFVLIISKAEMVLVAKLLTKNLIAKDDSIFEKCRSFMEEVKGLHSYIVGEICPVMIDVCKNILQFTNLDHKVEDKDTIISLLMQLKRRVDASLSISELLHKYYSSQLLPSQQSLELSIYCKSELLDYMICDGLEEISIDGSKYIGDNEKPSIILSWIMYSCAIFNSDQQKSMNDVLMKRWVGENLVFSHLAVIFCENI